ncbi:MAG TPA: DUF1232 domain-containing protein [Chthoniobacterales bacterium]|nr:DUF1232 domain-containing protein [Chthoniobacterales bacterium]
MKKKKTKAALRKKPAPAKAKKDPLSDFKKRMDAEFASALVSAKSYVGNPARLRALFDEAANEVASMPREPFHEMWPYLQTMLRLMRAYSEGKYRDLPESTLVVIVAAIVYLVNPLDVIPDALPALGYLDDATVVSLAVRRCREALDSFMTWELSGF